MIKPRNILLLFLGLYIFSCSKQISDSVSTKVQNDEPRIPFRTYPKDVIAAIERTECFGKCPVYKVLVFESGRVEYNGLKNVSKIGKFYAKLNEEQIALLIQYGFDINYFDLDAIYSKNVSDLPITYTYLSWDEYKKGVVNHFMGPEKLNDFEEYFDLLLDQLNWVEQK